MRALILLLILTCSTPVFANWGSCTCVDPCGGGPLCCGAMSLAAKGGITASSFTNRSPVWLTRPLAPPFVTSSFSSTRFSDQFCVPWTIGAELGWNGSGHLQIFLEYGFARGEGKRFVHTVNDVACSEIYTNYTSHAGYLGSRYFFDGRNFAKIGRISPYAGFKAGLSVQRQIFYRLLVDQEVRVNAPYWRAQTAVSGGVQMGLEWWFCNYFSLAMQGEFVATCGPKPNQNIEVEPPLDGITHIQIGTSGWLVSWPITLALRYTY